MLIASSVNGHYQAWQNGKKAVRYLELETWIMISIQGTLLPTLITYSCLIMTLICRNI
jgi:hypothetical protein